MDEEAYYLDTSAIVKRYAVEPGSEVVDGVLRNAYRGLAILSFSC